MKTANAAATLASVVFLKIQEFARRPVQEQARLRAQLEAVVAVTTAELAPASRIVLDAADGAAIVVLGDPKGALRLAERALAATAAGLPLCVGVNHGAVQLAGGRDGDGLIGDGIAVAASVADFASPSRLLMSRSFRDAMADASPGLESGLFPAGVFTDAGLRTHELFSPDGRVAERRRTRFFALSVAAVIGLIGAGVAARVSAEGHQKFVEGVVIKIRQTIAQGERVLGGVIEKVRWQKRS
jgi:class 3 adenylate cyclase